MSLGRTFKLNSGYEIPAVGLGTWVGVCCFRVTDFQLIPFPNSSPSPMKSRTRSSMLFARATVTSTRQRATKMKTKLEMGGRSRVSPAKRSLYVGAGTIRQRRIFRSLIVTMVAYRSPANSGTPITTLTTSKKHSTRR